MPTYSFKDNITGEEFDIKLSMAGREKFVKVNNVTQIFKPLFIHSGRGIVGKTDDNFNDLLKEMKNKHSQGISKSTIKTRDNIW
jgi:hypothetical protein